MTDKKAILLPSVVVWEIVGSVGAWLEEDVAVLERRFVDVAWVEL